MLTHIALLPLLLAANDPSAQVQPHGGMLRFPDVSATQIVFVYADDLWLVPREGGVATPLASPPGSESLPRFSPDGKTIAFVGNYDGNRDIYTIPVSGGVPTRVTYHPVGEVLSDWTPDGKLLFFDNGKVGRNRQTQMYTVSPQGGLPEKLPVPYGAFGAISPSGEWLAYTPHTADSRTWKRYRGGMATDIWLFHLKSHEARRVTTWEGTDTQPMWQKDKLYYLSDDGPSHRLNIWAYDPTTDKRRQVTSYADFDVKWPAIGPGPKGAGEIVFQHGADLMLLDLASEKAKRVEVTIPGARATLRQQAVDASKFITAWSISPTGKRAVMEARGDIWTAPAKEGSPRNLTRTSGAAERYPAWSPDGKWIAYSSDASGEYQLTIAPADGKGEPKTLTHGERSWKANPAWSPDSKWIAFSDQTGTLFLQGVDGGDTIVVDKDPYAGDLLPAPAWSHDSRWLAWSRRDENDAVSSIWLYERESRAKHKATSGMFADGAPVFDRKGDWMYFASSRSFQPMYGEIDLDFLYAGTQVLLAVPLRADVKSPLLAKSDEEKVKGEKGDSGDDAKEEKGKDKEKKKESAKDDSKKDDAKDVADDEESDKKKDEKPREKVEIALDGFERRAVQLPVEAGVFGGLAVNDKGALVYSRQPIQGSNAKPSIQIYDMFADEPEEKSVADGTGAFEMSANGKKLLLVHENSASIVDAAASEKGGGKSAGGAAAGGGGGGKHGAGGKDEKVVTEGMITWIEPRAEWNQIFNDAWRLERDWFYDPNMHHVDWNQVRKEYGDMIADCATRQDLSYIIREMISELNVGHAYYSGGDVGEEPKLSVGLLGCDFALDSGAYRISRVYEGAPWDSDARGPLSQPGVDVKAGDYLLAVNGAPVDTAKDPWASFQGLADKTIRLTVSSKPTRDADARDVNVKTVDSETELRYRAWIEERRAYVEKKTGGKVGYVYVPSTGVDGQNDLVRQFYGQIQKAAMIIDERWNSGGQIPTRFIELLNRPLTNYWARRDAKDWPWPPDSHQGPKCMLINGLSGSGGDAFPAYFKMMGIGKVIGTRTWGGLVGLSGNPRLIDGGDVTVPTFGYYKKNGTWGVEGHGVDPDIEVIDDPSKMVEGPDHGVKDPQLDAAIELMLAEIEKHPYIPAKRPAYPDRSGMGVLDADR